MVSFYCFYFLFFIQVEKKRKRELKKKEKKGMLRMNHSQLELEFHDFSNSCFIKEKRVFSLLHESY